jgi:hypothetical protein
MPTMLDDDMVQQMSGASPVPGMPSYPLYGVGQAVLGVPFYKRPLVCFSAGVVIVGAAWAYFGWWRPRQKRIKANKHKKKIRHNEDDE